MTNVELNLNQQNPNHQERYHHFNGGISSVGKDVVDDVCNQMMDAALKNVKACSNCNATKTSLWRSGPLGPKSLCNACYLKNRKYNMKKGIRKKSGGSKKHEAEDIIAAKILVYMSSPYYLKRR